MKKTRMGRPAKVKTTSLLIIWRADDTDIIDRLEEVLIKETKADYIRKLIRRDIKARDRARAKKKNNK